MNLIVTGSTALTTSPVDATLVNKQREWSSHQDGPNDKTVDIWYNNGWTPAYFKDILKGDFFIMIGLDLEPGRCFLAGSNARSCGRFAGNQTYIIPQGMEIVQAPALVDINPASTLPHQTPLLEKE